MQPPTGAVLKNIQYSVRDRLIERFNDTNVAIDDSNLKRVYDAAVKD